MSTFTSVIEQSILLNQFKFAQLLITKLDIGMNSEILTLLNWKWHLIPFDGSETSCWWTHYLVKLWPQLDQNVYPQLVYWIECYEGRNMLISSVIKHLNLLPHELIDAYERVSY